MNVTVITVSDTVSRGEREDKSGPSVAERCRELQWEVSSTLVVSDNAESISTLLKEICDDECVRTDVILTTGGTGVGPRDTTPEATHAVCERFVPGFAEEMRRKGMQFNSRAILSRGICGIRKKTIIINLPGSPKGAVESLDVIAHLLPHAIQVLHGARHD